MCISKCIYSCVCAYLCVYVRVCVSMCLCVSPCMSVSLCLSPCLWGIGRCQSCLLERLFESNTTNWDPIPGLAFSLPRVPQEASTGFRSSLRQILVELDFLKGKLIQLVSFPKSGPTLCPKKRLRGIWDQRQRWLQQPDSGCAIATSTRRLYRLRK